MLYTTTAAIIVVYYPAKEQLRYFRDILSQHIKLYIVDNTPLDLQLLLDDTNNIRLIRLMQNNGISRALNVGIKAAHIDGYERMFLFDQDTIVDKKYLDIMMENYNQYNSPDIGFFVPDYLDRNSNSRAKYPNLKKWTFRHGFCSKYENSLNAINEATIAITSGILIDYANFEKIGPFREDLFIDFVDNEYAMRAACKGLLVHVCCDAIINHSIGKRQQKRFFGIGIKPNHHHPIRRFFIARNGLKIALEYKSIFPSFLVLYFLRMIHEVLSIILYENLKISKIRMIISGINSGFSGNMDNQRSKNL